EHVQRRRGQQVGTDQQDESGRERGDDGTRGAAAAKNAGRLRSAPVAHRPQERRSNTDEAVAGGCHWRPTLAALVRCRASRSSAPATSPPGAAAIRAGASGGRTSTV